MKCKRLNVKLIQNVCSAIMHHRLFNIKNFTKLNESKPCYTLNNTEFVKTKYGVKYCIQYRPV